MFATLKTKLGNCDEISDAAAQYDALHLYVVRSNQITPIPWSNRIFNNGLYKSLMEKECFYQYKI